MGRAAPILLGLLLSLPAAAGEKVDLTAYLTGFPVLGDFKEFQVSNGDVRREETVHIEGTPSRWLEVVEAQLNGTAIGAQAGIATPGKKPTAAPR
jgi:hypothetical protein